MTTVNVTALSNTITVTEGDAGTTVVTAPVTSVVTATTQGPQGPPGAPLPVGGNPGDVLMKDSYANYDADWAATLDGGTFF